MPASPTPFFGTKQKEKKKINKKPKRFYIYSSTAKELHYRLKELSCALHTHGGIPAGTQHWSNIELTLTLFQRWLYVDLTLCAQYDA